jgi:hypothetical protein
MVQEEAFEKISTTAKLVAHIRSFTDIPFTKEIAAASGAVKDFQTLTGKSVEFMTHLLSIWRHATKLLTRLLHVIILHKFWKSPLDFLRVASQ